VREWDYLDGNHTAEEINYVIVEGSIPLDASIICSTGTDNLEIGKDIIAIDNCDVNVSLEYSESTIIDGNAKKILRSWYTVDECGNETGYSQIVTCEGVGVRIKAMLQGALLGNNKDGLMRDDLRAKGLLPLTEPYSFIPSFLHIGSGGEETVESSVFDVSGNNAIVDWVFIELKSETNQEQVLATKSALIQRDGDVVSIAGNDVFDQLYQ